MAGYVPADAAGTLHFPCAASGDRLVLAAAIFSDLCLHTDTKLLLLLPSLTQVPLDSSWEIVPQTASSYPTCGKQKSWQLQACFAFSIYTARPFIARHCLCLGWRRRVLPFAPVKGTTPDSAASPVSVLGMEVLAMCC